MTRQHLAACLATFAVLSSVALAQTSPKDRDVWYEYVQDGVRYGSRHVSLTHDNDGNLRYTIVSKVLTDLFGVQKQNNQTTQVFVVTPSLRPISVRIDSTDLTGKSQVRGTREGDELVIRSTRDGVTSEARVACGKDKYPLFDVCVADRLASLKQSTTTTTIHVITEPTWDVSETVATRKPSTRAAAAVWGVSLASSIDGLGSTVLSFSDDGVMRSTTAKMPRILMRRCTEAQAKKLTHLLIDGSDVLTYRLDKPIERPSRLRSLEVRISWKDIPFAEFELEDARQRIIKRESKDGVDSVVVAIAAPTLTIDRATIPIRDAAMAPYLAEGAYLKPKDAAIIKVAKAAIAGETNATAAVRALSTWVNEYIDGQLVAGTLTGPQVLACRRGKCTEFATLFGSMTRAVGIPTRVVLGERMITGRWMGHMWNEAYVGRWITVDAGFNEVDESQLLLKFIHSDTVMGTQSLRFKLTASLQLSIESFALGTSNLDSRFKTGLVGATYTNTDHAFRISARDSGWSLHDKSTPSAVTLQFKNAAAKGVLIHLVAFRVPKGTTGKMILDGRKAAWDSSYNDLTYTQNVATKILGSAGHILQFNGLTKSKKPNRNFTREVAWVRGDSGYLMNVIALEGPFKTHMPHFEKLLKRFRFLSE